VSPFIKNTRYLTIRQERIRETDRHNESFLSLSTKEPHLACSLSVTMPAAVVRTVAAVAVMVVVATAVKGTIGSNLRAGNRNRGLAARASHTPRVLLSFVLSPRNTYTWDSWQAGDRRPRDRLLERVSSLRGIDESSVGGDARYQTITVVSLLQSRDRRQSDIGSF